MLIQQTIKLGSMTFEITVLQFYCSFQTRMVFSSLMYIISFIIFLLILDLGSRWGEWSASRRGCALPPVKRPPVPFGQEAGWAPEPVWTQKLEEKSFASTGDRA
jgi:hypothetical protein